MSFPFQIFAYPPSGLRFELANFALPFLGFSAPQDYFFPLIYAHSMIEIFLTLLLLRPVSFP